MNKPVKTVGTNTATATNYHKAVNPIHQVKVAVPKPVAKVVQRQGDVLSGYRKAMQSGNLGGKGWGGI